MRPRVRPPTKLWLPKAGNAPEEYEDAFSVVYPQRIGTSARGAVRAAVADGASESAFAREWANELAGAFATAPPDMGGLSEESLGEWLAPARRRWNDAVPWDRLPWHGEAKARAGAFATLVGLTVRASGNPRRLAWQALAVGDSCFFVVRDGRLALSFPVEDASEFDSTPDLFGSSADNPGYAWEAVRRDSGECMAGDLLILASDAIAHWFLGADAAGEKPWETVASLDSSDWDDWVAGLRRAGLMRNDDVTLLAMEVA